MNIGHIKGHINPVYRNIYCASGVIHLVDTVLAIPQRNAYQEIASHSELTILKSLIDQSSYANLLNQPVGIYNYALISNTYNAYNQQGYLGTGVGVSGMSMQQSQVSVQRMSQTKNKKSAVRDSDVTVTESNSTNVGDDTSNISIEVSLLDGF